MQPLNEIVITVDQDWAPDFACSSLLQYLQIHKVKATWFITHDSPFLKELRRDLNFQIGIHPNFLQGSTQGKNPKSIMDNLKEICPEASAIRTHAMVYSASIARMFALYGLLIDSSIYLGGMSGITPYKTNYADGQSITRIPYYWSDDAELAHFRWRAFEGIGLKVLCFHPIHFFLNTPDLTYYEGIKKHIDLSDIGMMALKLFVNVDRFGVADFLENILNHQDQYRTLLEVINERRS